MWPCTFNLNNNHEGTNIGIFFLQCSHFSMIPTYLNMINMFHHDMLSFDTVKMNKCDNLSDILIQTSVYRKKCNNKKGYVGII